MIVKKDGLQRNIRSFNSRIAIEETKWDAVNNLWENNIL